jgi:hypothetical protein
MVSLLDLDPELGAALDAVQLRHARLRLGAHVEVVPQGPWEPAVIAEQRRGPFGVLVIEGLFARELSVAGGSALELFGPSDVLTPWLSDIPGMLEVTATWSAVESCRIAVLEPGLTHVAAGWPPVLEALAHRAGCRAERLSVHHAIAQLPRVEQRIVTLLWYVSERWGRVTADGVSVTLPLNHSRLGQLVGARRPTVSLALKELDSQDLVHRRDDGTWLLPGRPPATVAAVKRAPRREHIVAEVQLHEQPEALRTLAERIVALRGRYERNLSNSAEILARSQLTRSRSQGLVTAPPRRP